MFAFNSNTFLFLSWTFNVNIYFSINVISLITSKSDMKNAPSFQSSYMKAFIF